MESTTKPTVDTEAVAEWCKQVRDIYNSIEATPVRPDQFGEAALEKLKVAGFEPADYLHSTMWRNEELPTVPIERPAWAKEIQMYKGTYPAVSFEFVGQEWGRSPWGARIVQYVTIVVDEDDGTPAGTVLTDPAKIDYGTQNDSIDVWDALALSIALEDAATELRGSDS